MLYYSSNVAALQFAEIIGRDNFYKYLKMFGYGQPTGIDLAGEAEGIVHWPIGDNWSDLTLDTNSFGQGIAVTPSPTYHGDLGDREWWQLDVATCCQATLQGNAMRGY